MKKTVLFLLVWASLPAWAQEDAWVFFNAKPESATYLSNPLSMLTQRSLDRRTAQGIAVDFLDVPVHQPYIDQVENATGIEVMAKSKWYNAVHVRGAQPQIAALSNLAFVDHIRYANPSLNVGDRVAPAYSNAQRVNKTFDTTVDFDYGESGNQIEMLNGHLLHQEDYTGAGKIIAVMDGGFPGVDTALPFERLRENGLILGGYDYVNRNPDFYTGISHGTLVLSTMGGYQEGELVGTAPDAGYYLYITEDGNNEGPLEESLWVEAAEEADRLGVDIITTSLGYSNFDNADYNHTYEEMDGVTAFISQGVNFAFSRGIVCVVSAGNSGNNDWYYITAPADATHALAVGAVDPEGDYVTFSSHGPSFDGRVKPDVSAQGRFAVVSNVLGDISTANGTSFACPIIAGMVASFWQAVPQMTNAQLVQYVKQSASIYNNPNDDIGYGIPNFADALEEALGTQVFPKQNVVALYPNPVGSDLHVRLPAMAQLTLYNSIGQQVLQQYIADKDVIGLGQLESGVYFYQLESNGFSQRGKLLKK
ncbi:S8 family serine peptidase [Flavobacterium caeni]|uniref:Por secretion system C-terminal sorting domain-containing protein n=1 Tax=Flavobacterium caeni TaxID=490189 RepID=A0A1G5JKF3_9FLAO|nr:S8 family serine peptidase [Flavobacterium caeni]SCY88853.1 Por secretion system C-terminal sorting domain-containing protein [Flavobacterium caeni]